VYVARTGQEALTLKGLAPAPRGEQVINPVFSPDGARIATAGGGVVRVYDARTGQEALALKAPAGVFSPVFSPDGTCLATGGGDGVVRVWTAPNDTAAWQAERRAGLAPAAPTWHRACAAEAERSGDWYAADFHLGRLSAAEPANGLHHFRRGLALAQLGRAAEADQELEKARALQDDFPETTLADAHAELGRWDIASKLYARAAEARRATADVCYRHALLCLSRGDRAGYAAACSALVQRFGKSQNSEDAKYVAWSCALGPEALRELQPAVEAARRAVQANSKGGAERNALGAILYRAGQYDEAVKELNESIPLNGAGGTAIDFLFLAMAHHRLGKPAEAQKWLEKATQAHAQQPPVAWTDRLEWQLLHGEAEALLKEPPPDPKK
jgi:tetratricopeptide (TPR) repeat protein